MTPAGLFRPTRPSTPATAAGPLLAADGSVIGVNTFKWEVSRSGRPVEGLGFAVSEVTVRAQLAALKAGRYVEASPSFGKYYRGKTLDLNVVALERTPELRYNRTDSEQVKHHYSIRPASEDLELVLLRVKVENHTATSAIVNVDERAARVAGFPA